MGYLNPALNNSATDFSRTVNRVSPRRLALSYTFRPAETNFFRNTNLFRLVHSRRLTDTLSMYR